MDLNPSGQEKTEEKQQVEAGDVPATASAAADGSGARMKPLSDFEIRVMEKLEAELDGLNGERDALQKKVDGFDSVRNGYTELTEWTEAIDELGVEPQATFGIAAGKIHLAPAGGGQHDIGVLRVERLDRVDIAVHQHHAATFHTRLEYLDQAIAIAVIGATAYAAWSLL